jgi:DNA repair exonuclease SbcCD ATPase subunit
MVKKVIEIDVDVLNAQGGLDKFVDTLKETEQQSVSLKAELRKLKEQLATLPEGTAEYDKIAKRAGEVSDQIGDINTKVKNLGSDTKGIDAVVQGAQTLSGAFSVASSASALLGDENEDLQKTMLKVESAIGLTVGVQSIANALQKESALVLGIQSVATKAQILLQTAYTAVVGTSTGALKALKVALISTGIGAFVVLLGSLISAMSSSTEATDELTDAQKRLNRELEDGKKLTEDFAKRNDFNTQIALANARKRGASERELLAIELEGIEKRGKANQKESEEILAKADQFYNLTKEQQERVRALKAENEELERQGKIKIANFDADMAEKERERQKKAIEDAKKSEEEKLKDRQDARKKELDAINEQAKIIADNIKKNEGERLKNEIDLKKKADEILKQIELELAPEETPTEKLKREYEERLAILTKAGASTLSLDAKYVTDKLALEKKLADEQKANRDKQLADEKILQEQRLNTLGVSFGKISELLGKNSKAGRAFAVSQALINTYQGITAELATKTATPYEFGVKLVNIASVVGIGFKAVKDILKTPDMSTGGSGASAGGGGGGAPSSAPQFNVVGNAGINQIAQTMNKEQAPVQAYVVGNKVTTQQALDRNIVDNASL